MNSASFASVEDALRAELAQGDHVLGSIGPILRNLLASDDISLFSDEIVARVRGMVGHVARQLLAALAEEIGAEDPYAYAEAQFGAVAESLVAHPAMLGHAHALALEWQLTERLHTRNGFDPALSPLLQAQIASRDASVSEAAMTTLAAQVRFLQHVRRMELPLGDLPGDLFHAALQILRSHAAEDLDEPAERAAARLRGEYDESQGRLGRLSRLVMGLGAQAPSALAVDHAGVALFLTALSLAAGLERDLAALSTNDRQLARLALSLRAAGLKPGEIEAQFVLLHPDIALPEGFDALRADSAAALLAAAAPAGS